MKKVLCIGLSLLFIAGCSLRDGSKKEEKFVNSLFYKQLVPIYSNSHETFLTPNSQTYSNSIVYIKGADHKDGWTTNTCRLLENENDYIVLKCQILNNDEEIFFKYSIIDGCFLRNKQSKCIKKYVKEYSYDKQGNLLQEGGFEVEID